MSEQGIARSRGGAAALKRMTSPVNWGLLGLLLARAGYGYQLVRRFEEAYAEVLTLGSESHIYTALNELSRRGLIEELADSLAARTGTNRQPKIRYRATAAGAKAYREHMFEQAGADRRQSQLFVRKLAAMEHEPEVALEVLRRYEQTCLAEARRQAPSSDQLIDRLLAVESRLAMEGKLPWVEYARDEFSALQRESTETKDGPART
jgi:DNA-binding PadR family transcriptional regulator